MDVGPLGSLSIAAHAEAHSVTLSRDGSVTLSSELLRRPPLGRRRRGRPALRYRRRRARTTWPLHPTLTAEQIPGGHLVSRDTPSLPCTPHDRTGHAVARARRRGVRYGLWSDRLGSREPAD